MKRKHVALPALCIVLAALLSQCTHPLQTFRMPSPYAVERIAAQPQGGRPRNIILMVGDGMSLAAMATAWTANRGRLNIENCPVAGLAKTYSANRLLTDSAAAATAFATGHKAENGHLGLDAGGSPHASILEIARRHGLSAGLVATCSILDATPAAFVAKKDDRHQWADIAAQYAASGVDFVCGGGRAGFTRRQDEKDLAQVLAGAGYQLPRTVAELQTISRGKVFALIADNDLPAPSERGDALTRAAQKAIELLGANPRGFFLMIEGSLIDDGGHENRLERMMDEIHDFDRTAGAVLRWAAADGETLVVITSDHETGGWTLLGGDIASGTVKGRFTTDGHSGVMVPVYAFGPGAEAFTGIFENTDLFAKMLAAFGFGDPGEPLRDE